MHMLPFFDNRLDTTLPALITADGAIGYGEYRALIATTAARLQAAGLRRGDRVALWLQPDWRSPVLLLAMLAAGIVAAPLNTRQPASRVPALLRRAGCSTLVASEEALADLETAGRTLTAEALVPPAGQPGASGNRLPNTLPEAQPATIIFTSGSSGESKAALHTWGNHYYSAVGAGMNMPFGPGDRWLLALPLYHVGGLSILFRALISRATVVLPPAHLEIAEAVVNYEITHVSLVATQLYRWLQYERAQHGQHLRAVLVGGSAVAPSLLAAAHSRGLPVFTTYGATEMASQIATTRPGDSLDRISSSSGRLLPFRELRITATGEILVRGKTLFRGYANEDGIDDARDASGWFATGDLGHIDAEGYLTVRGRKDNQFISGGENIQPEEIEAALCRLPGVEEAVVVPVAHAEFGQRPFAFVRTRTGEQMDVHAWRAQLATELASYKIPDRFHAWPAVAETGSIKVDRTFLQQLAGQLQHA